MEGWHRHLVGRGQQSSKPNIKQKAARTGRNYLVLNVNRAKIEQPWVRWWGQGHRLKSLLSTWSDSFTWVNRWINIVATELSRNPSTLKGKQPQVNIPSVTQVPSANVTVSMPVCMWYDFNGMSSDTGHKTPKGEFHFHVVTPQWPIHYLHEESISWRMLQSFFELLRSLQKEKLAYNLVK